MGVDTTTIGRVTAELMESIEGDYPDGAEVKDVIVVVEVLTENQSIVHYRCSDKRGWVQRGLLLEAIDVSRHDCGGDDEGDDE